MLYQLKTICLTLACIAGLCAPTRAGIVLDLSPPSPSVFVPTTGNTTQFTIEVRAAANTGTQLLSAYNIPIDLGLPAGTGTPAGWSVVSVAVINEIPGFPDFTSSPPDAGKVGSDVYAEDGVFPANATPLTLTTDPLPLFSFTVELSDQALAGTYEAIIVNSPIFAVTDGNGDPITPVSLNSATIELRSIPEPSTASLCLLSWFGFTALSRRRRTG